MFTFLPYKKIEIAYPSLEYELLLSSKEWKMAPLTMHDYEVRKVTTIYLKLSLEMLFLETSLSIVCHETGETTWRSHI